ETHALKCAGKGCTKILCERHEIGCSYCAARERYCADHIGKSFEDRAICPVCASPCAECRDVFPPAGVWACAVCERHGAPRRFCSRHKRFCPGCGKPHCVMHADAVQNREDDYCLNCHAACAACAVGVAHYKEDLKDCKRCGDPLCQGHRKTC